MFKRRDISGKEYLEQIEAREMKYKPLAVWRARKLGEKVKEVFEKHHNVSRFYVSTLGEVAFFDTNSLELPPYCTAVLITKLWVIINPIVIIGVLKDYGFDCLVVDSRAWYKDRYYSITKITDN